MKIGPKHHPDFISDPLFWLLIVFAVVALAFAVGQELAVRAG